MKFGEHYAKAKATRPVISYEVFPPKDEPATQKLFERVLPRLVDLGPDFMTVTYGALGTTQDRTLEIASRLKRVYGIETASHLTCVGSTPERIDAVLEQLRNAGINTVVAVRGEPPAGEEKFVPPEGGFSYANELIEHLRERGADFGVAVAGYPERHIEAPDDATDLANLKRKVDAGADIVITQLFYDNDDYFQFVDRARKIGITVPIVAGLLPIQSLRQIKRITSLCGSKMPARLEKRLSDVQDDPDAVKEVGVEWAIGQCEELFTKGVDGIHFYVLNRAKHMERITEALKAFGLQGA